MKTLTALALAVGLALSVGTAADAMTDEEMVSMGQSMLTGALYNRLRAQGYGTDGIENLTLNEIVLLNSLLTTDSSAANRDGQIKLIFERAMAR
jgi:hypothetical protein